VKFAKGDLVEHVGTPGVILEVVRILNGLNEDEPEAVVVFWGALKLDASTQEILDTHVCAPGKSKKLRALFSRLRHANAMEVIALASK
jgi:hypothetical protein